MRPVSIRSMRPVSRTTSSCADVTNGSAVEGRASAGPSGRPNETSNSSGRSGRSQSRHPSSYALVLAAVVEQPAEHGAAIDLPESGLNRIFVTRGKPRR